MQPFYTSELYYSADNTKIYISWLRNISVECYERKWSVKSELSFIIPESRNIRKNEKKSKKIKTHST